MTDHPPVQPLKDGRARVQLSTAVVDFADAAGAEAFVQEYSRLVAELSARLAAGGPVLLESRIRVDVGRPGHAVEPFGLQFDGRDAAVRTCLAVELAVVAAVHGPGAQLFLGDLAAASHGDPIAIGWLRERLEDLRRMKSEFEGPFKFAELGLHAQQDVERIFKAIAHAEDRLYYSLDRVLYDMDRRFPHAGAEWRAFYVELGDAFRDTPALLGPEDPTELAPEFTAEVARIDRAISAMKTFLEGGRQPPSPPELLVLLSPLLRSTVDDWQLVGPPPWNLSHYSPRHSSDSEHAVLCVVRIADRLQRLADVVGVRTRAVVLAVRTALLSARALVEQAIEEGGLEPEGAMRLQGRLEHATDALVAVIAGPGAASGARRRI